jgi:hypothetical protein
MFRERFFSVKFCHQARFPLSINLQGAKQEKAFFVQMPESIVFLEQQLPGNVIFAAPAHNSELTTRLFFRGYYQRN